MDVDRPVTRRMAGHAPGTARGRPTVLADEAGGAADARAGGTRSRPEARRDRGSRATGTSIRPDDDELDDDAPLDAAEEAAAAAEAMAEADESLDERVEAVIEDLDEVERVREGESVTFGSGGRRLRRAHAGCAGGGAGPGGRQGRAEDGRHVPSPRGAGGSRSRPRPPTGSRWTARRRGSAARTGGPSRAAEPAAPARLRSATRPGARLRAEQGTWS